MLTLMPALGIAQTPQATPDAIPEATSVANGSAPWWQGAPCYEIFVRSFADGDGDGNGDLRGMTARLDYLNDGDPASVADLGVTCIWLMPIMEAVSYHGYDVTDYYAIERDYGTREDFLAFMDAARQRGIHVIIDLVINHTSVEHPWFVDAASGPESAHRDWYIFERENPGYPGPWGDVAWHPTPGASDFYYGVFWSGMPDLDFRNPEVTAEIRAITEFWLAEMGVDGFRLDAVKHLIEDGRVQENTPETIAWLSDYATFIRSVKPDAYTVGEVSGANSSTLAPYYPDTLDQFFHFELAENALSAAQSGSPLLFSITVRGAQEAVPGGRYATFLTNHDQPRVATRLGGDERAMRVAAMLLLSTPGTPFIYYGEEIGMSGDKPDELIRTPMQWSAQPSGGFTSGTPWEPLQPDWRERNVAIQTDDPGSLLNLYRTWVQLRTAHSSLSVGTYREVEVEESGVMAFTRAYQGETTLVVINTSMEPTGDMTLALPEGASAGDGATDLLRGTRLEATPDGTLLLPALAAGTGTVLLLESTR
jgi:glycosidase